MSTARVLIKQGDTAYRFLRVETSNDGSLICFLDKDPQPLKGAMSIEADELLAESDNEKPVPYGRFTIHTTGQVHRYSGGDRKGTSYIEPLHQLTKPNAIGFLSIPEASRLDLYDPIKHQADVSHLLEIPAEISERLTFLLEIGPVPMPVLSYGIGLNYEVYSLVTRMAAANLPGELASHFVEALAPSLFSSRQVRKDEAELGFYQRIYGSGSFVFREDSGAYLALTSVPMARAPNMTIEFSSPHLSIEIIPYEVKPQPTHKVRFFICDKGGRNKSDDLRHHIRSVAFNARL
ncbi:hypothetical protein GCM10007858_03110 [Bradyrhizobium liaoningense]|uniref:hypothetical protein n=1 Tax=Bradyrhizobium liaoningense TaxID=43992 RepID=UPI00235D01D2|nr:hypothetical protein [Bradyrhizobium liaoningense]GLR92690.1 hypothetical protein GCM10007858_03110 [Bradyrhizobium liaoningense]